MHRRAAERVRRAGHRFRVIAYEWEYQSRGVLHMHVIVSMTTAQDRAAAHAYVAELDVLRHRHGFGQVDRGKRGAGRKRSLEVIPAGRAARYLAKYLAPRGEGGKLSLTETVTREDVPARVVYVGRHLTARTRVTMRTLRLRRAAYMLHRCEGVPFAGALAQLLGERPTFELLAGDLVDDARGP